MMDLFQIAWNALSPYVYGILKIALAMTLFSLSIKVIRQRSGMGGPITGASNPWGGIWTAFLGYLLGRGIPIVIGITDTIVNDILAKL